MVQFHPFRDVTKENIRGSPNFGSEKTVELFCGKLPWGGGSSPLQRANRDVPLDGVAFS